MERARDVLASGDCVRTHAAYTGAMKTAASISRVVDDAVRILVAEAHPSRIILFGSAARGVATEGSDLDFLVVLPQVRKRYLEMVCLGEAVSRLLTPYAVAMRYGGTTELGLDRQPGLDLATGDIKRVGTQIEGRRGASTSRESAPILLYSLVFADGRS